jgi:hypothetical protein
VCRDHCDGSDCSSLSKALVDRLLKRVEEEIRHQGRRDPPAGNAPGENIDDERDVDEAPPGCDVGEIPDPELIRPGRRELPIDEITGSAAACDCGDLLDAARNTAIEATHQHQARIGCVITWVARGHSGVLEARLLTELVP